jgi:hypothetical protein
VLLDLLTGGLFEMGDLLVELELSQVQRTKMKLCETFSRCACARFVDAFIHLGDQRFEIIDLGGRRRGRHGECGKLYDISVDLIVETRIDWVVC